MRIILATAGAALIATLAGCGENEQPQQNQVEVPGPQAYQQELMEMPESARNAVFIRAILDADRECQHVESSSYVGEESTLPPGPGVVEAQQAFPVWQVRCLGGEMYNIMIQNDGVAAVIETAPDAAMQLGQSGGNQAAPAANAVAPVDQPANAQQEQ